MQRKFLSRTIICLVPTLLAIAIVVRAYLQDPVNLSGFKLGIDLSGGTILVYEVDQAVSQQNRASDAPSASSGDRVKADSALAEAIKRRIDGSDLQGVVVRPLGDTRVEIILPYGGRTDGGASLNENSVEEIKAKIRTVGSLEFRILANQIDDAEAYAAAREFFKKAKDDPELQKELEAAARAGLPPRFPNKAADDPKPFDVMGEAVRYEWVELARNRRAEMGLSTTQNADRKTPRFEQFASQRTNGEPVIDSGTDDKGVISAMYWSRPSLSDRKKNENKLRWERRKDTNDEDNKPPAADVADKFEYFDYFVLTRISDKDRVRVGGDVSISASVGSDKNSRPSIAFVFNTRGGDLFYTVTSRNKISGSDAGNPVVRQLAIILDGLLISSPTLNEPIRTNGEISSPGGFERKEAERIVNLLRSGALPATLKSEPVSQNTIGPTLGRDTIVSGTRAVIMAFIAVLIFMVVYYRFAGFVATAALFANLVLTIGFMLTVNATFTLPGLAGLVLTLGMAVDANVLIYERVREERDRGLNLLTAIRNGYDRALPTIIDTHLASIFTAVVLYTVGNDQLKGFGVSLTAGLAISLFTSLYMTRLIFDFWHSKNWLTQLRMMRLFSRPNIDFMKIRKQLFVATMISTLIGAAIFFMRGQQSLNVDFVGGTAYSGRLKEATDISKLRQLLGDDRQAKLLKVEKVEPVPSADAKTTSKTFVITYSDGKTATVALANAPENLDELRNRASQLRDWSVEQVFTNESTGSGSTIFNVRSTEREKDLVLAAINRLMTDDNGKTLLTETTCEIAPVGNLWAMKFSSPVSKSLVKTLLEREFQKELGANSNAADVFEVDEIGEKDASGRYTEMRVRILATANEGIGLLAKEKDGIERVLKATAVEFASKPQAERLETFDGTLASETRTRALYAILASWFAILLYLWFRFGNWTFGAAAVVCLVHDLCFTLGAIAVCHYIHDTSIGKILGLQDFKIDFPAVAALLTLVGYSVNDTIVVFDRIKEVRGKNPALTPQIINDSVNQTLSRTVLASFTTFLVVVVLYFLGGEGVHLFSFVMIMGVLVGTYSSIYIASPLLLIFGEGRVRTSETPSAVTAPAEA
jgi:SecD/SecF fusion protein